MDFYKSSYKLIKKDEIILCLEDIYTMNILKDLGL